MPKLSALKSAAVVPLLVVVFVAITFTAMAAYTLISRGITEGHPSWIALGTLSGGIWLFALRLALKPRRS